VIEIATIRFRSPLVPDFAQRKSQRTSYYLNHDLYIF
jgi:hypothetical protein